MEREELVSWAMGAGIALGLIFGSRLLLWACCKIAGWL